MTAEKSQENIHPDLMTSLTIIGASLSFADENWDQFAKEMEFDDIDDNMKELMHKQLKHLLDDISAHISREEMLNTILDVVGKVFGNG